MNKIIVGTFLTLDSVMQAPGGPDEDTQGGFQHGGWQGPFFDEDAGRIMSGIMAATDALLLGRKTYEIFAAYWPHATADEPIAQVLNSVPKFIVSQTLNEVTWNNSTLIKENVAEEIARLKQRSGLGNLSVTGSGKRLFEGGIVPSSLKGAVGQMWSALKARPPVLPKRPRLEGLLLPPPVYTTLAPCFTKTSPRWPTRQLGECHADYHRRQPLQSFPH